MSSTLKKIIIVVVVLAVGFFAYSYFFVSKKDTSPGLTDITGTSNSSSTALDLSQNDVYLKQLIAMRSISFDLSIFTDIAYKSLHTANTEIPKEPQGRHNPFAPIEQGDGAYVDASPIGTTTTGFVIVSTSTSTSTSAVAATSTAKKINVPATRR